MTNAPACSSPSTPGERGDDRTDLLQELLALDPQELREVVRRAALVGIHLPGEREEAEFYLPRRFFTCSTIALTDCTSAGVRSAIAWARASWSGFRSSSRKGLGASLYFGTS